MGVVGLGLWTWRLSAISQALRSRRQVALIGGALVLMMVTVKFWLSTWNVAPARLLVADWKFQFVLDSACSLFVGVVSIALMVWVFPSQRQRSPAG